MTQTSSHRVAHGRNLRPPHTTYTFFPKVTDRPTTVPEGESLSEGI